MILKKLDEKLKEVKLVKSQNLKILNFTDIQIQKNIKVGYTKEERAAETQDGNFDYHEPKKFKSQIDANFDKLADEKDY